MKLIGLNGLKGSGKDTAAQYLADQYGFTVTHFAAKLKASAAACFGMPVELWESAKNKEACYVEWTGLDGTIVYRTTARQFLQRYGTEAHRDIFGDTFWLDALQAQFDDPDGRYAIADARFPNELAFIQALGGEVWRIERAAVVPLLADAHASEAAPPTELIDVYVDNNGSIADLHASIDRCFSGE